jgi:hypothetical protein
MGGKEVGFDIAIRSNDNGMPSLSVGHGIERRLNGYKRFAPTGTIRIVAQLGNVKRDSLAPLIGCVDRIFFRRRDSRE